MVSSEDKTPVLWIHGCRNEAAHALRDELSEIAGSYDNFNQHVFYDDVLVQGEKKHKGRVELSKIKADVIREDAEYYICGPAPFIAKHYDFLLENGVADTEIHFEEFGPASLQLN